jgi:isopropylmalate/homocitrate/citramalate synthase
VGQDVFIVESGIGVMFFENAARAGDPFIAASYQPELVGQPHWRFALGKKSGIFSVQRFLREMGRELDTEKQNQVLAMVKDLSIREKRLVTMEEFEKFVDSVSG